MPTTGATIVFGNGSACDPRQHINWAAFPAALFNGGCVNSGSASFNAVCSATALAINMFAGGGCAPGALLANASNVIPVGCSPYNFTYGAGGVTRLLSQSTTCYGTPATASPAASTSPTASLSTGASPSRTPESGAEAHGAAAGWVLIAAAGVAAVATCAGM